MTILVIGKVTIRFSILNKNTMLIAIDTDGYTVGWVLSVF